MTQYKELPYKVLWLEVVDQGRIQQMINRQRRENPTDAHLQLVMDRQQERLDKRAAEFFEYIAELAARN